MKTLFLLLIPFILLAQYNPNYTSYEIIIRDIDANQVDIPSLNITSTVVEGTERAIVWSHSVPDNQPQAWLPSTGVEENISVPNTPELWSGDNDAEHPITIDLTSGYYQIRARTWANTASSPFSGRHDFQVIGWATIYIRIR